MMKDENTDGGNTELKRMMKWIVIALIATLAFAIVVVEITLRWFAS
jgi:hypothetical protein